VNILDDLEIYIPQHAGIDFAGSMAFGDVFKIYHFFIFRSLNYSLVISIITHISMI
jgi:hypothetical protein